ncbi:MAG TPA: DUF4270 family protein [Bacteroidales bacterium]|nr:DUF4270 family protein [Bacteroidales bacterium]
MKFIQHIFWILVPAVAIALSGCSNGEYVLGGQYLDSHMHTVIIDTCTVKLSTVQIDSVETRNTGRGMVGRFTDDRYFGKVEATTYLSYSIPPSVPALLDIKREKIMMDSCVLIMILRGSYIGDTLKTHDIEVHKLKEAIEEPISTESFWSNDSREYNEPALATYKLHPRPGTIFKSSLQFPYHNYTNHFYVRLPDTLGIGLLNKMLDNNSSTTPTATEAAIIEKSWLKYFPGIAITAGANNSGIFGFGVRTDSLCAIRVYYHYVDYKKIKGSFNIPVNTNRYFYGVKCDRKTGLPFSDLHVGTDDPLTGEKEVDSKKSGNVGLIQALTSTYVKVEFPYLNNLLELGDFCAITDAALLLYPADKSYSDSMPLPGKMSMYISDEHDSQLAQVTSSAGTALTGNLKEDEYKKDTYYTYDISSFLSGQLGKTGMYKRYLQFSPSSDTLTSSVNTMLLADPKLKSDATRVIIKFLIYENE